MAADDVSGTAGGGPPSYPGDGGGAGGSAGGGAGESGGETALPSYPQAPPSYPPPPPPGTSFPPPRFDPPAGTPYASWGIRLGGWLIDFVLFFVVQIFIGLPLRHSNTLTFHHVMTMHNGTVRHTRIDFLTLIITGVVFIVYASVMLAARGQTVGMMAVGLKAVPAAGQGEVSFGQAFGRALLEQVLRITVVIWILDMLWPLWDQKRQTLHDKAAGTVVIRVRNTG
jgi:uncharacterized RDD family membrane protein YckC